MSSIVSFSPYEKGWMARKAGESVDQCPYILIDPESSNTARAKWLAGWNDAGDHVSGPVEP